MVPIHVHISNTNWIVYSYLEKNMKRRSIEGSGRGDLDWI